MACSGEGSEASGVSAAAAEAGSGAPVCTGAVCVCQASQTRCGGLCANLNKDPNNCGACGATCNGGACDGGRCVCPSTLTACDGSCVDITTDLSHCGVCNFSCGVGELCQSGVCMQQCNPQCVGGQLCHGGTCACPAGQEFCGNMCVDLQSTPQHCGACGKMCTPGQLCQAGQCVCPMGQITCDNQCVDIKLSPQHCGACGQACDEGESCMAGVCRAPVGADGCTGDPRDVTLAEVAAYQTIKISLAKNGTAVPMGERASGIAQHRPTMFRFAVTTGAGFVPRELSARVTVTNGNDEDQYFSKQMIAKTSTEEDSASTFQVFVPADRVLAGTKYRVEVVECGTTAPGTPPTGGAPTTPAGGSVMTSAPASGAPSTKFPATGDAELGAVDTGKLRITILPIRSNNMVPDTSDKALDVYRQYILAIYPLAKVEFMIGDELPGGSNGRSVNWNSMIEQIRAKRAEDAPDDDIYYYGMLRPTETFREYCMRGCTAGVGYVGSATQPATRVAMGIGYADGFSAITMAHEVAHNHGRNHAPCPQNGGIQGVDRNYPYPGAQTGVWGFDSRSKKLMSPTENTDLMGYCDPKWISDYTYDGLFTRLLAVNGAMPLAVVDPATIQRYSVLLNDQEGPRWSHPLPRPSAPHGLPESADVLDIDGNLLDQVTVYRTEIGDADASSILIPESQPGWHAIKIHDALPLPFTAPVTVPMWK